MNSDSLPPEITPPAQTDQEATTTTRRRRTRRTVAADTPPDAAAEIAAVEETPARRTRRSAAANTASETPAAGTRTRRTRSAASAPVENAVSAPAAETPPPSIMTPLSSGDALVTASDAVDQAAGEGPLTRSRRRRRGRGGRGAAEGTADAVTTDEPGYDAGAAIAAVSDEAAGQSAGTEAPDETVAADETGAGRRRRRRGRGGRGNGTTDTAVLTGQQEIMAADLVEASDLAEPHLAAPEPAEPAQLSPAVQRRFDRRDWRERPGRASAASRPAIPAPSTPAAVSEPAAPVPFGQRPERGSRYGDRRPAASSHEAATPPAAIVEPAPPLASVPPVTPSPIVMPEQVPAQRPIPAASASPVSLPERAMVQPLVAPSGGTLEERLERLLTSQVALLQQQQQAMQGMMSTISALQGAIDRMTTTGIAAGMPRAGIFVDAPNIIYAAENARINIDYGRMLDFLGRGREMVHAIVYAPVTEEGGFRFEGQRFVAPFLRKGYKLVTKPLKRFPDGTAKGNFDIELAIDIVTMSQRLDVVILISGDSDFSRLIELIQSRGVRVEVVAFASNVSWELVQMADVFIDIGQYLNEFRAI